MGEDRNSDSREITFEQFEEVKKADRAALLALPPDEAQQAVDQILHPRLWQITDNRQLAWPDDLADDPEDDSEDD